MRVMNEELTTRQWQVLSFINRFRQKHQCNPTCAEIATEFGFSSPNAAKDHLRSLEAKGAIRASRYKARGIYVNDGWQHA